MSRGRRNRKNRAAFIEQLLQHYQHTCSDDTRPDVCNDGSVHYDMRSDFSITYVQSTCRKQSYVLLTVSTVLYSIRSRPHQLGTAGQMHRLKQSQHTTLPT